MASGVLTTTEFAFTTVPNCSDESEAKVRATVGQLISRILPKKITNERRRDFRYPYPHLIYLTPVDASGQALNELSTVVVGKNITERGIDFFHRDPLPYRRVILTLEAEDGTRASMVTDLLWTRFTRQGWYDNGGRFLQVLTQNGPC
ncbi:hypothetical protein C5Y96_25025 [Blastopirellula marina]|uniref:Uncharacterized protein n=1 Tax=Blastopirellula marina TaxID=124 RepID=A0A2S8EZ44_9BACT|nr:MULTISPECIES: hypothetical protein [Pirellulaceae]PQO25172.1 hypothetical protein C5Y96_25025 [Blastopirellula marina]RCS41605.1 hypothetical protein DTL36_25075 [Bremerella cremea]